MVSATDWKNVMNLPDLTSIDAEYILDLAIDCLNLYGANISNMAGDTPGSKTVTLTSKEKAAVFIVARAIYYGFYREVTTASVAGLAVGPADLMSNPQVLQIIREAAKRLEQHEGVPFTVAEDTSGIE